ncbi:MAG: hypothetical protein R2749_18970 [Acidimicrobiales bacterium]
MHRHRRQYVSLPDAYLSVVESLNHAAFHFGAKLQRKWIEGGDIEGCWRASRLSELDGGIVIPASGFGARSIRRQDLRRTGCAEESTTCPASVLSSACRS